MSFTNKQKLVKPSARKKKNYPREQKLDGIYFLEVYSKQKLQQTSDAETDVIIAHAYWALTARQSLGCAF